MTDALEYMPVNFELRSVFLYFAEHTGCTGITWDVHDGIAVELGQVLGRLTFANGEVQSIRSPVTGTLVRTYNPDVADLPHRPSVTIALFEPADTRATRDEVNPWRDIRNEP